MQSDYSDELQHYGVPGMKWGVHRAKKGLAKAGSDGVARTKAIDIGGKTYAESKREIERRNRLYEISKGRSDLARAVVKTKARDVSKLKKANALTSERLRTSEDIRDRLSKTDTSKMRRKQLNSYMKSIQRVDAEIGSLNKVLSKSMEKETALREELKRDHERAKSLESRTASREAALKRFSSAFDKSFNEATTDPAIIERGKEIYQQKYANKKLRY